MSDVLRDLQDQKANFQAQLANLTPDSAEYRAVQDEINIVSNKIAEQQYSMGVNGSDTAQINATQTDFAAGLKEEIYQILDVAFPSDITGGGYGLTEYNIGAQEFRSNVDFAIDEKLTALFSFIGQQMGAKDDRIREMTAQHIEIAAENDKLQKMLESDEETIVQLQTQLSSADRQLDQMTDLVKENASLKEQNAKLEELTKAPQPQIIIPSSSKPSQTLQDRLQESGSKVKSALELALAGQTFRGKITVEPPTIPSLGGSESTDSFRIEDTQADAQNNTVLAPTPPTLVGDNFRTGETDIDTMGGDSANGEMVGEARIDKIEKRLAYLEGQLGISLATSSQGESAA